MPQILVLKVLNVHKRTLNQSSSKIAELLETLATENDMIIAKDKWPRMKLDNGLRVGSKGGHGPIRYSVQEYIVGKSIQFKFSVPKGFGGFHKFEIADLGNNKAEIQHTIDMRTSGIDTIKWLIAIRWLHDAYIEDAFDKLENHFSEEKKSSVWNLWVKFLRWLLNTKRK